MARIEQATCIGCGCTDSNACFDEIEGEPCHWKRVDRKTNLGVCSSCRDLESAWDAGDRSPRAVAGPSESTVRKASYAQPPHRSQKEEVR